MTDIAIVWSNDTATGDWAMAADGDLMHDDDLASAVLVSIFTHRTASDDFVQPDLAKDPRGWWGDSFNDVKYPIGSRLWQFYRAIRTDTTLADVRDACAEALQWLVDDGVADSVSVTTQWAGRTRIGIRVDVRQGDGPATRFSFVWRQQEA